MPLTALIVDDNLLALRLTRAVLERDGHKVVALSHWSDVADMLYREEVDIALVDVNMPGLQGDKLVEILKQTRRGRNMPLPPNRRRFRFAMTRLARRLVNEGSPFRSARASAIMEQ